jgi:molecular chaperone DnaK (HSP70)
MENKIKTIGIDLGTTNTVIFSCETNAKGSYLLNHIQIGNQNVLPSVIFFETKDQMIFGSTAYNKGSLYPEAMAHYYKTKLGATSERERFIEIHPCQGQHFLFDTNIYLDHMDILESHEHYQKNNKIILPNIILNELDHRKNLDPSSTDKIEFILDKFNKYKDKNVVIYESDDEKISEIKKSIQEKNLFFTTHNDQNDLVILSWLLSYQNVKPVFVSEDKALVLRAKTLLKDTGITVLSYHEYLDFKWKLDAKQLTTYFLKYVLSETNRLLKTSIENVVIGIPAAFNPIQIEETKSAAIDAGFINVDVLQEPVAAAIAYYELDKTNINQDQPVVIYDFGGGTFDFSMVKKMHDLQYEVIFNTGDNQLGGRNCTLKLVDFIKDKLMDDYDIDIDQDRFKAFKKKNIYNIEKEAERAKLDLSSNMSTTIRLVIETNEIHNINFDIRQNEFESVIRGVIANISRRIRETISQHNYTIDQLQKMNFFLAGGSTFIPLVRKTLDQEFKVIPRSTLNPAYVIAQGAAISAFYKYEKKQALIKIEKTSYDIGVLVGKTEFCCLIHANISIPNDGLSMTQLFIPEDPTATEYKAVIYRREFGFKSKDITRTEGFQKIGVLKIDKLPKLSAEQQLSIEITFHISTENILDVQVQLIDRISQNKLKNYKLDITLGAI